MSLGLGSRIALQATFFATLGLGAYAVRRFAATELHPLLLGEYADIAEAHANIASTLSLLADCTDTTTMRTMLDLMRRIVEADRTASPRAQWDITRWSAELLKVARGSCSKPPLTDDTFRSSMLANEETLPMLQGQLDDLLHNHLLSRGS